MLLLAPGRPAAAQAEWTVPRLITIPDEWHPILVPRRIDIDDSPNDPSKWVVLYSAPAWNRLKALSAADCATGECSTRVVMGLTTDADVQNLRKLIIPQGTDPVLDFFVGTVASVLGPLVSWSKWLVDLMLLNSGSNDLNRQSASAAALLAKGGEVKYEERISGKGPFFLDRVVYYRVVVGKEVRVLPIWVSRLRAEIE
jgi:hypothetical protein